MLTGEGGNWLVWGLAFELPSQEFGYTKEGFEQTSKCIRNNGNNRNETKNNLSQSEKQIANMKKETARIISIMLH